MKLLAILVTLICLFTFLVVSCGSPNQSALNPKQTGTAKVAPEWVTQPSAPVYLNPKSQHVSVGNEFTFDIEVIPSGWGVSACEINLSFDPKALEVLKIKPGDLLGPSPLIGTEKIDNKAGTVTYALARAGATKLPGVKGVFAILNLKAQPTAKGSLRIDITKIGLADEKFEDVKVQQTQGATVIVD